MAVFLPGVLLGGGARELALTSCAWLSLTRRAREEDVPVRADLGDRRADRVLVLALLEAGVCLLAGARRSGRRPRLAGQSGFRSGPCTGPSGFVDMAAGLFVADLIPSALPRRSISSLRYCIVSL